MAEPYRKNIKEIRQTKGFSGLITPAILIFFGWLILGGIIAWSKQVQIMVIIGLGIWWLTR